MQPKAGRLVVLLFLLSLVPGGLLIYLLVTDQGQFGLKLFLLVAFLVLALRAGVPVLRASGVKRDRTEFSIRNWFHYKSEFEGPERREKDDGKDET